MLAVCCIIAIGLVHYNRQLEGGITYDLASMGRCYRGTYRWYSDRIFHRA